MSEKFRVVITDFINDELEPERRVLGDVATVAALNALKEQDLIGRIEDADAIMIYHNLGLSALSINQLGRCKVIVRCGVGIDNVDRQLARQRGIDVCNVPDYGTEEVADSAIGLMLSLTRGINFLNTFLRESNREWTHLHAAPLHRLRRRTLGIVGLGRIGSATAVRAKALGMEVAFYDPYLPDGYDKALGVRRVESLEALLAESHVLSLHCPLSAETRHMIDARAISQLRCGAYLINTAHGAVVDTSAIPDAIASGQLAGAGIDVLDGEPPSNDNPLLVAWRDPKHPAYQRLIVNPHVAFYSEEGSLDMRTKGAETAAGHCWACRCEM